MKKLLITLSAVMIVLMAVGCSSGDPKKQTKLTQEQIEARNFVGDDCITYVGTNFGYTFEESTDGKVLVDLDFGDQYGLKAFFDTHEFYYYINEDGKWCKITEDVMDNYVGKEELKEFLEFTPQLARTLDDKYLQGRDLEVIDYRDGVTYVQGKADNPFYYEDGDRFTDWKIRYTLDDQEIIVIREEYEQDTFWSSTSLISGEYPEGFNFNNYDFDFENNVMVYNGQFGNDIEKYQIDIPFEVVAVRTYEDMKEDTVVYEYDEEGTITAFTIKDIIGDTIFRYSGLRDDIAFEIPENCVEGDINDFADAFVRAMYVSGLADY